MRIGSRVSLFDLTTPGQRFILGVAFAQLPGNLGASQLDPQIKGMAAVVLDLEMGEKGKGIVCRMKTIAVKNVYPFGTCLNAITGVTHVTVQLFDILPTQRKR